MAAVAQQRDEWGKQAKAELGDQYDAEVKFATTAVHALQNPKLVEAFDNLGWGNHPELIKAFAMFGKMMRDSPVDGIGNGGAAKPDVKPPDSSNYSPKRWRRNSPLAIRRSVEMAGAKA